MSSVLLSSRLFFFPSLSHAWIEKRKKKKKKNNTVVAAGAALAAEARCM